VNEPVFWVPFILFVLAMLALDLSVFHRQARVIGFKEALGRGTFWIVLAAAFAAVLYFWRGQRSCLEFAAGYLVEESLSFDNLFVFMLIFRYFRVPEVCRYRVLFWGITNAMVLRALFIATGIHLIDRMHWLVYPMGAFLMYTGIKFFRNPAMDLDPSKNLVVRGVQRWLPVTPSYEGTKFFVRSPRFSFTPLFTTLIVLETVDVLFATDSIPAVLGVTHDPFIVYTSNIFAILGLRSFYFALAGMIASFHYLHYALSVILIFIGLETLLAGSYQVPAGATLAAVVLVLAAGILASVLRPGAPGKAANQVNEADCTAAQANRTR
jgi:tellurite resistance protein TerC